MAHDFAKKRARRELEKQPPEAPPAPAKGLLVTGLLIGLVGGFVSFYLVYLYGFLPPIASISAETAASNEAELAAAQQRRNEELEQAAARLQLEFYKELPNYEVIVDNMPQSREATPIAPAVTASLNTPAVAAATPAPSLADNGAVQSSLLEEAASPIVPAVTAAPQPGEPGYMIQAGAFQQENAALAQSQRLTALGLETRVRKEALLGKTLFLVQAGPYYGREQVSQAERVLRSNSIDTMRIGLNQ